MVIYIRKKKERKKKREFFCLFGFKESKGKVKESLQSINQENLFAATRHSGPAGDPCPSMSSQCPPELNRRASANALRPTLSLQSREAATSPPRRRHHRPPPQRSRGVFSLPGREPAHSLAPTGGTSPKMKAPDLCALEEVSGSPESYEKMKTTKKRTKRPKPFGTSGNCSGDSARKFHFPVRPRGFRSSPVERSPYEGGN